MTNEHANRPVASVAAAADENSPVAVVLRAQGTNCDRELGRAFELAGARVRVEHIDTAVREPEVIAGADLIGLPGGFSYGDDVGSGRLMAVRLRERLWPALRAAAEAGVAMIGVCNGFQVLVQVGLLPGPEAGEPWPQTPGPPEVALASNAVGRFVDRWVEVEANASSPCLWTAPLVDASPGEPPLMLPVAHGEGRFVGDVPASRVALRYVANPNGSAGDVAGICDATGRIFGLMPHPERFLDWTRHPFWTRLDPAARTGPTPGRRMFAAAVEAARSARAMRG